MSFKLFLKIIKLINDSDVSSLVLFKIDLFKKLDNNDYMKERKNRVVLNQFLSIKF